MNQQSRTRGDKIEHRWRLVVHADGCHWFASTYACVDCGASLGFTAERDLNGDPYSAIWMEPEDGEVECERCRELIDGAEPETHEEYAPA